MDHIRNFSIIAHIDHGKSTLADRIIQRCGGLTDREMEEQVLDSMELERERGITIKAQTAALLIGSLFDNYVGVVMLVRLVDGSLSKGERIRLMATDVVYGIEQLGVFTPKAQPRDVLRAGEVGFLIAGIKELHHAKVGDTV